MKKSFRHFIRENGLYVDEVMAWENKPGDYSFKIWYIRNKWFLEFI